MSKLLTKAVSGLENLLVVISQTTFQTLHIRLSFKFTFLNFIKTCGLWFIEHNVLKCRFLFFSEVQLKHYCLKEAVYKFDNGSQFHILLKASLLSLHCSRKNSEGIVFTYCACHVVSFAKVFLLGMTGQSGSESNVLQEPRFFQTNIISQSSVQLFYLTVSWNYG